MPKHRTDRPCPAPPPSTMSDQKSVLITGAAVRLGAALTRVFAQADWKVYCHYERSAEAALALASELCGAGHQVIPVQASLSSAAGCLALIDQIKSQGGHLDGLINNASAFEPDTAANFEAELALQQLQVNLLSPLLLSKGLAQELLDPNATEPACVIHVLDQKVYNLNPDYFSYTLSKLALERAVALQAQALAPKIRVCGVAPGLMYVSGPQTPENFAQASRANLLRRPTDPLDVAKSCLFLATNPAITGSTLCVDNGQHLVPLPRDILFVVDELLKGSLP